MQQVRSLAVIIGEEALSSVDRAYLAFGEAFERNLWPSAPVARHMNETLDLGWVALAHLPSQELARVTSEIQAHFRGKFDHHDGKATADAADAQ